MNMIWSMTGYGQASGYYNEKKITVEIKSLNGKTTDVRMRLPSNYADKEVSIRKIVTSTSLRGKMELNISSSSEAGDEEYGLNMPLVQKYLTELSPLLDEKADKSQLIASILRIPNVVKAQEGSLSEEEWNLVSELCSNAATAMNAFRAEEGKAMFDDFTSNVKTIEDLLVKIEPHEANRIERIKSRLETSLLEKKQKDAIDQNRYEQEIIFYLEKLDINEEKVRLTQHCKFFMEQLHSSDIQKGKKLGFIAQEMGREINTLGAKAQDPSIQQLVVRMKDELEKIKEQVANIV